jgi:MerR HTH family regulatory protein
MSATEARQRYTSGEVSTLTGATYRQIDYWASRGMLGPRQGKGDGRPGSGWRRGFSFPELVLARAYVLASEVAQVRWLEREPHEDIWAPLVEAYGTNEQLEHVRLIVDKERAYIGRETKACAALIINLSVAASDVRKAEIQLRWRTDPARRYRAEVEDDDE